MVDQLITYAKKNSPHQSVRYINQVVTDKNASKKVMEVLKDRYASRSSGLTRMKPAGARTGDGAEIVDLELVDAVITIDEPAEEKKEKKIKKPEVKEEKSEEKVEKKEEKKAEKKEKKAKKEKVKASKKKSK